MATSFLRYTDAPLFANFSSAYAAPNLTSTGRLDFLLCSDATLNFENSLEPRKFLGKTPKSDDFSISGPLKSTLSFSYFPLLGTTASKLVTQTGIFTTTGDSVSGYQIRVGNFLLKQCHLNSYSVKISPYQAIQISAEFQSYDTQNVEGTPFTGWGVSTSILNTAPSGTYMETAHALSTKVSGQGLSMPQSKTEINISCSCSRNPIYTVGNRAAETVILNSIERTTTVNGENVGQIVEFDGGTGVGFLDLDFYPFKSLVTGDFDNLTNPAMSLTISGKVTSQNLSMQPGQSLQGSVVIKENLF